MIHWIDFVAALLGGMLFGFGLGAHFERKLIDKLQADLESMLSDIEVKREKVNGRRKPAAAIPKDGK